MVIDNSRNNREESILIILGIYYKDIQCLLDFLVGPFGGAVGLGVVGCRESLANIEQLIEARLYPADKLQSPIAYDYCRKPMVGVEAIQKAVSHYFYRDI